MKIRTALAPALIVALLVSATAAKPATAAGTSTRQLVSAGTTQFQPTATGSDSLQSPEFPKGSVSEQGPNIVNRVLSHGHGERTRQSLTPPVVAPNAVAGATPGLNTSFNGLTMRDQRLANGGNQFSVEPPDQGLCVGNGFVLESVNDVLRVYDKAGHALVGVEDLNTFYGYPAQFNRTTGQEGPFVTDPTCYYDTDTQRWFQVVLTLDVNPSTGAFPGTNHLDIAVSQTSSPLGTWKIYHLDVTNDGDASVPGGGPGPYLGDYPHIGADRYGFYITTNAYPFFANGFNGAQLYAMSKHQLAAGVDSPTVVHFGHLVVDKAFVANTGFTVEPATSPAGIYADANGGTEYFLSSLAAEEAGGDVNNNFDNRIALWALTNTQSLDTANPNPTLSSRAITSEVYGNPPNAEQKPGDFPLGQCLNIDSCATLLLGGPDPYKPEVEGQIATNDSRMLQVVYANGLVWGALNTVLTVNGVDKAGIAYFVVQPVVIGNGQHVGPQSSIVKQGYVAAVNNNVTFPAVAVRPDGKGEMAFTLVGNDYYPSAAYAPIDAVTGVGDIHVAGAGLGPQDGFTEYRVFAADPNNPRPRWGDYGAAAVDGSDIWMASEYIGQTCTLQQYATSTSTSPLFSCGRTRVALGNWYTRISNVTP